MSFTHQTTVKADLKSDRQGVDIEFIHRSFGARLGMCQFPDGIPSVDTMKHAANSDSDRGTPKQAENFSHEQAYDTSFHHYCF
jgi:hypothetical protein